MQNRNTQGKRYGLQVLKKPVMGQVQPRLSVFEDDSDSEHEDGSDWVKKAYSKAASKNVEKKQTKLEIQRAIKEDPTVYQYDEIYEQLEEKKQEAKSEKTAQEKKPRYIQTLIAHAEQRKREQERRTERQVQKEREAEGEAFKDKEAFITASYRKKLEEFRKLDEEERRRDELEAIGDVSKQEDLSGFYRHLYRQTVGENKPIIKQENDSDGEQNEEVEKKQDEPDIKQYVVKIIDADSNIGGQESEITKGKNSTNVSHVSDQVAVSEVSSDTEEETSNAKPKEHDKNKRPPLSEIPRKVILEKHFANESNQDADTEISSSSSESDSDTENKSGIKKETVTRQHRQYRRRHISSPEESTSESERETLNVLIDNKTSTGNNKIKIVEEQPVLNNSFRMNINRMINGNLRKAEKENKTNVLKENSMGMPDELDLSIYIKRTVGAKFEEARRKYLARKAEREANNIFF